MRALHDALRGVGLCVELLWRVMRLSGTSRGMACSCEVGSIRYCSLAAFGRLVPSSGRWVQACAARASLFPGSLELLGGDAAPAHVAPCHLGLPVTRAGGSRQRKACMTFREAEGIHACASIGQVAVATTFLPLVILLLCSLPLDAKMRGALLGGGGIPCLWAAAPDSLPAHLVSRPACMSPQQACLRAWCRERKRRRTEEQGEGSGGLLAMGMDVEEPVPSRTADVYGSRDFGRGGDYG